MRHLILPTSSKGFTVIEMLVTLALLALLASAAVPLASMSAQRGREAEVRRDLWMLRDAIDAFHQAARDGVLPTGAASPAGYPKTLEDLTRSWPDARAGHQGESIRFLRAIPRDPFAETDQPADQTWAVRSFLSEPSRPKPGEDVYDVHSLKGGRALDGTELSTW